MGKGKRQKQVRKREARKTEIPSRDDYTVCYITEGEKKSLFANHVLHAPVVSLPGVNSFGKVLET